MQLTRPLLQRFPHIIAAIQKRSFSQSEALCIVHGAVNGTPNYRWVVGRLVAITRQSVEDPLLARIAILEDILRECAAALSEEGWPKTATFYLRQAGLSENAGCDSCGIVDRTNGTVYCEDCLPLYAVPKEGV